MKKLLVTLVVLAVLIGGFTASAHAQGGKRPGPGGPGRPGPKPEPACLQVQKAVHDACPCNGPDGKGWASHEAYVECVTNAANAAVGAGANQDCATRAIEHATKSQVGTAGFECKPERGEPGGTREPREPRPTPGAPGEPRPGKPGPGQPGEPKPNPECAVVAKAVQTACPCEGTDGKGWASHEAYVECVTNAANAAVAGGAAQDCATRAIEGATKSKIGTAGFECKPQRGEPGTPRAPRQPKPTTTP